MSVGLKINDGTFLQEAAAQFPVGRSESTPTFRLGDSFAFSSSLYAGGIAHEHYTIHRLSRSESW